MVVINTLDNNPSNIEIIKDDCSVPERCKLSKNIAKFQENINSFIMYFHTFNDTPKMNINIHS